MIKFILGLILGLLLGVATNLLASSMYCVLYPNRPECIKELSDKNR